MSATTGSRRKKPIEASNFSVKPNERLAFVGKTRSGKSKMAIVLGATIARALLSQRGDWEVWWIDTKNDPEDLSTLRDWGFRNWASDNDRATSRLTNAVYYYITEHGSDDRFDPDTVAQAQEIFRRAYNRRHVIVCVDEYTQVVPSQRMAGKALHNIFTRGGGRGVGIIGLTQEPVYVPRQLISQATHQVFMNVSYNYDVQYLRKIDPTYEQPIKLGDQYGFWWRWVDGGVMSYFPNQEEWYEQLQIQLPSKEVMALTVEEE
jgi:energy-coupling factor transporter ATP-binding protein EcfA2